MIAEGRVALNGTVIETPATLLTSLAGVTVDGHAVREAEAARLFLYHKPKGLLVTERDPKGRPTIYDRLPKGLPRVVPVGRLDLATEGLLLLTTDGGLKRQLELPATGVERVYRARAYGDVSQAQLEELSEGVAIEGVRYGAIDANMERRTGANVWIELKLTEGKNREVRRVLEYLGLEVSRLIRTRYGPFVLGDLPVGAVGEVRAHDIDSFRKNPTRLDLPQPARAGRAPAVLRGEGRSGPRPATGDAASGSQRRAPSSSAGARQRVEPEGARRARSASAAAGPQGKPARPAKAKAGPRQRADGTLAVRSSGSRADRSRTFRGDRETAERPERAERPARPARSSGTTSSRGPGQGRPTRPSGTSPSRGPTAPRGGPRPPRKPR
ncbi:MAG: pseudouridine synthase [Sphingomonas sp.]|uniref:pseudouridine synthase n=1 Tax=Sphingomonas sp. TaxID=28214 RepID=UPI003F802265